MWKKYNNYCINVTIKFFQNTKEKILLNKNMLHWLKWNFRCLVTFDREDHKCDSQIRSTRGLREKSRKGSHAGIQTRINRSVLWWRWWRNHWFFCFVSNFTLKEMDSCNYNIQKQDSKPVSCLKTVFHSHGESFVPRAVCLFARIHTCHICAAYLHSMLIFSCKWSKTFLSLKYFSTFCSHSTFRTHLGQVIYSITHFKQTFLRTVWLLLI